MTIPASGTDPAPRGGDWTTRTGHVAAAIFFLTMSFVLAKTGRDALYFQRGGLLDLPKAYLGISILAFPTAAAMLALMRTLGPRRARITAPLLVAAGLIVFQGFAVPGGGPSMTLFYMIVPLVYGVLFSLAWLLAADLLEGAPRDRIARSYGIVGAASILGGTLGGAVPAMAVAQIEPARLLLGAGLALVASAAIAARSQARFPVHSVRPGDVARAPERDDFVRVLRHPYSLLLLTVAMSASLVGILVEFQFYLAASVSGNDGPENVRFFARFYLLLNGLAFLAQLWLMPRLQKRLGVRGSLFILPIALLGGAGLLLANASVLVRTGLRVTEGGLKSSVHRSNWEQAYLGLTRAERSAAKLVVDGAGARLAEGFAAGILFVWLRSATAGSSTLLDDAMWMTWAMLLAAAVWVTLTFFLRRTMRPVEAAPGVEDEMRLDIPLPDT